MIIKRPYYMEIRNKDQAAKAIVNMCTDCLKYSFCSGADAKYCNELKNKIRIAFTTKQK